MDFTLIELIQSIILIIVSILTIILSVGILRLNSKLDNVVYARIHILGAIDIMAVVSFIVLDYPLLGVLYFILAPFTAHAIAHGFYYGEDTKNNKSLTNEDLSEEDIESVSEDLKVENVEVD